MCVETFYVKFVTVHFWILHLPEYWNLDLKEKTKQLEFDFSYIKNGTYSVVSSLRKLDLWKSSTVVTKSFTFINDGEHFEL